MRLKLVIKFLPVIILGGLLVSCVDDGDEYVAPTIQEELELLDEYLEYLESEGMDVDTTDMGVFFVTDSVGNGTYPVAGDTCVVKYTGFLLNGDIFDYTGNSTFEFVLEVDDLIDGWTDGVKEIDEEGKAYLIIPSVHGYGTDGVINVYGSYSIPPNTTIVFYIEMEEIKALH